MSLYKYLIFGFLAGAAMVAGTYDTRIGAGIGAALLLAAIAYGTLRNRTDSRSNLLKAERGAKERREERAERKQRSAEIEQLSV